MKLPLNRLPSPLTTLVVLRWTVSKDSISFLSWRQMSRGGHLEVTSSRYRHQAVSPAVVTDLIKLAPSILGLTLRVTNTDFTFHAGQWVDFMIPDTDLVGGYSMCSSPEQLARSGTLQLAVKKSTWPPAQWIHNTCRIGSRVLLRAGGEFRFPPSSSRETDCYRSGLLLVAGGVGINPLLSILLHCAERPHRQNIVLLYSAKTDQQLIFQDTISDLEKRGVVRPRLFVTAQELETQETHDRHHLLRRRLGQEDLQQALRDLHSDSDSGPLCYLCGPGQMLDHVSRALYDLQVPADRVHFERWW